LPIIAYLSNVIKSHSKPCRACECWQDREVRGKSKEKGRQKGGKEREKGGLVCPKKHRKAREKPDGSSLWQMVAGRGHSGPIWMG
jgi:hypothetical protein